jgi:hypothetical protein
MNSRPVPPAPAALDVLDPSSPAPPSAPVLALPRNRRRPVVMVWGLLVVLLGGLAGWWGVQQSATRTPVVSMASDVKFGEELRLGDFVAVDVLPDSNLSTVPWASLSSLVGKRAATDLLSGTLVSPRSVTNGPLTGDTESVVGVTVKQSQAPVLMLQPRDRVLLVVIPASTDSLSLTLSSHPDGLPATVLSVGALQSGGGRTVDVIVPNSSASAVAALAASGRLALAFQSRG